MLPSHSSCLTEKVKGPAVNLVFGTACIMSGHSGLGHWRQRRKLTRSSQAFVTALESEHRAIGRKAEEHRADRLEMRLPPLGLLRGGMHVAEAALERAVVEDRRRA